MHIVSLLRSLVTKVLKDKPVNMKDFVCIAILSLTYSHDSLMMLLCAHCVATDLDGTSTCLKAYIYGLSYKDEWIYL